MPDLHNSGFGALFQMKVWAGAPANQALAGQTQRLT